MDLDWIKEFDKTDKIFSPFYNKKVNTINLFLLYVEKDENSIFHIKKERISLHKQILSREQIIKILKKNMNYNKKRYRPISILKYNIHLKPENISNFIHNPTQYNFLESQHRIKSLAYEDSIEAFEDMNSLHIVFYEKWKTTHNNGTRKIYLRKLKRKSTRSKRLKEKVKY